MSTLERTRDRKQPGTEQGRRRPGRTRTEESAR
jgi:hypothetical protein